MNKLYVLLLAVGLLGGMLLGTGPAAATELKLSLPLGRTAYQTNELIDLSVMRADIQALPAAELTVGLTGADGSTMSFTFPLAAVAAGDKGARATEHLHLNGWLLRPGQYTVTVKANERHRQHGDRRIQPPAPQHLQNHRLGQPGDAAPTWRCWVKTAWAST